MLHYAMQCYALLICVMPPFPYHVLPCPALSYLSAVWLQIMCYRPDQYSIRSFLSAETPILQLMTAVSVSISSYPHIYPFLSANFFVYLPL